MKKIIYIAGLILFVTSCESRTYEEISDNTPITSVVKYESDLKPIMESNCMSCHSASGFKPLNNYNLVKANIDIIINRIQRPSGDPLKMPQGGSLSANQIDLFVKWKADGLIEN